MAIEVRGQASCRHLPEREAAGDVLPCGQGPRVQPDPVLGLLWVWPQVRGETLLLLLLSLADPNLLLALSAIALPAMACHRQRNASPT